jgi:hypothetical protein
MKTPALSANGAKWNSLGQRPRMESIESSSAEGAKLLDETIFRAFSASKFRWPFTQGVALGYYISRRWR